MNRRGVEFSFAWLFAIIAGTIILFSAAYIATKLINTEQQISNTFVSGELEALLGTMASGVSESKFSVITFLEETRVFNRCSLLGPFRRQEVSTATRIGKSEWSDESAYKKSYDTYLFSGEYVEGKKMKAIVKPFYFPFKVGDETILYAKDYCLVNPTTTLETELDNLGAGNTSSIGFEIVSDKTTCSNAAVVVCFDETGCDVHVDTARQIVVQNRKTVYYTDQTLLAAILANPEIYECQLERLGRRTSELANVYARKAELLSGTSCPNNLAPEMRTFAIDALFNDSSQFLVVSQWAETLGETNDAVSACKLF